MSFRGAATLPGELLGCRVPGCPQSPAALSVALPPSLSTTSVQSRRAAAVREGGQVH